MIGMGTPSSQRRIPLPMMCSLKCPGSKDAIVPCTVTQRATFYRGKRCREGTEQHGGCQPERQLCGTLSRVVGSGLRLGNHIVDALLGLGLTHAGAGNHDLRHICFVGSAQILVVAKIGRPQPQNFRPHLLGICAVRRGG